MENTFVNGIKNELEKTLTENGANAFVTTKSPLVDLFGVIGSLRNRSESEVIQLFERAFEEDALLAIKMLFYARNIRGGLGERETFRKLIKYAAVNHPKAMAKNVRLIPDFGRWDDMYVLVGTSLEDIMWDTVRLQLVIDLNNFYNQKSVSLLAKWLKSINTSSAKSRKLGYLTASKLGLSPKEYRVVLSNLRKWIEIVETKMSFNQWNEIDFEKVPSRAMLNYRKAFYRQLPDAFQTYLEGVKSGEKKIHSAALYPYDILEKMYFNAYGRNFSATFDAVTEEQWKALPNYVDKAVNFLVMADTSGSMVGRPMAVSVSLAIYFAERNHGAFKDLFLTFSSRPKFVQLKGKTLAEKITGIESIVENTNLEAAFDLVLRTAVENKAKAEDMPKALIVISDGEIDSFSYRPERWTFLSVMEERFNNAGYELPKVVMWNVDSRHNAFIDRINNPKIQFISGSSPSTFRSLINSIDKSAYQLMVETLSDPAYDVIEV